MRQVLVFVGGLIVGMAVAYMIWAIPPQRHADNQFLLSALDQAYIGVQLQKGRGALVEPWIRRTLPDYVEAIGRNPAMRGNPIAADTLWMIRAYYDQGRHVPPASIQTILHTAPEAPPEGSRRLLEAMDRAAELLAAQEKVTISFSESAVTNETESSDP